MENEITENQSEDASEMEESILAPKSKAKRKMSEDQLNNLVKGREKREENRRLRAQEKEAYVKQLVEKKDCN